MRLSMTGLERLLCLAEPQIPVNFVIVARFGGRVDEAALRQALLRLKTRYLNVALRLVEEEPDHYCMTTENVADFPLRVVEGAQDEEWQQATLEELSENFDLVHGPMARMVLLKRASGVDLAISFHHAFADGMSGVFFLRDLLMLLNEPELDMPVIYHPPEMMQLIPESARTAPKTLKQNAQQVKLIQFFHRFKFLTYLLPRADRSIAGRPPWKHFGMVSRCLTQAQTADLVARCRQEKTTVHAVISAAWLRARLETLPKPKTWLRTISSPVNLRDHFHLNDRFGIYITTALTTVDCQPQRDIWDIAREIRASIQDEMTRDRLYDYPLSIIAVENLSTPVLRMAQPLNIGLPIRYDFSMTNLGRLNLPAQAGGLELECVYGPVVDASERELAVGIATARDRLTMSLAFRDFVLSNADAEKMSAAALRLLAQAAGW